MSSETSGFVTTAGIQEGETISKEDINATKDSWEKADNSISEFNIREEGLDRRSFDTNDTWSDVLNSQSRCYLSGVRKNVPVPGHGWQRMRFGSSSLSVSGGVDSNYPTIQFDWDPQIHTYVIIRASFWFHFDVGLVGSAKRDDSGDDDNFELLRDNHDFKFGILVTEPGQTLSSATESTRLPTTINGQIYCPTQVGLNKTWSSDSTGTYNQIIHKFDRRTAMATTVSMVVGGQSWTTNSAPIIESNLGAIDLRESGTVTARLFWKSRRAPAVCEIADSATNGQEVPVTIGNLQFFAQVFRR
jgi:hypothetical protein